MGGIFQMVNESLEMSQVARHFGYEPNRSGFIHSPFKEERTASLKLYENSFYDFSRGVGGDCIKFTALVLGVNNWEAAKYLIEAFSLPIALSGSNDSREQIRRRQREQRQKAERKQEFNDAWKNEVDRLKAWECVYTEALEKGVFSPLSELWAYVTNELQVVSRKLDVLCGTDHETYRRMKPDAAAGLSSGRPQWLLDTLAILAEDGIFQATQGELAEIQTQRNFELGRQPGKDRICAISW